MTKYAVKGRKLSLIRFYPSLPAHAITGVPQAAMARVQGAEHDACLDHGLSEQVKELGRGQFGSVWLARWLGVDVAVKELHSMSDAKSNAEMVKVRTWCRAHSPAALLG